ncbi:uncharacterized protein LOC111385926 [Olea europaea var. sylvestris]|uniref:uncharacterized protein LOC111385926 n=1 Tax=Olea europaea var. sylvestris TaxID=158386 RepID=UPI000C1CEDA2|nr:uncharacterized protein LOC111385926 [Olea europaea var. sylvestris]
MLMVFVKIYFRVTSFEGILFQILFSVWCVLLVTFYVEQHRLSNFDAVFGSSDLQLAIALQQQEFEQQQPQRSSQQQHPQRNPQQPAISGGSKLITGPPVPSSSKNTSSSSKQDTKPSKDKCNIM